MIRKILDHYPTVKENCQPSVAGPRAARFRVQRAFLQVLDMRWRHDIIEGVAVLTAHRKVYRLRSRRSDATGENAIGIAALLRPRFRFLSA
jgi:hypothetical protein